MKARQKHFKIFVGTQNAAFLSAVASDFKCNKLLKKYPSKIISDKSGDNTCLKISCDLEAAPFVKTTLLEIFTDCFLNIYKFSFLNERIALRSLKAEERNSLIKALTYFDVSIDRQLIYNALKNFESELFVESFLKFNLANLEKRWLELASLANDNSAYFTASETFLELLKFLIANLQGETNEVVLTLKNGVINLTNGETERVFDKNENELNVIITLISMLPKKVRIVIEKNETPTSAINLVCKLFENKICF